jgi:hypothetical protein
MSSSLQIGRLDPAETEETDLGGYMRRDLAFMGAARQAERPARSIACLAFVAVMGTAFWAGAVWIAETILRTPGIGL